VEISHEADERELYQQGNAYSDIEIMRKKIKEWNISGTIYVLMHHSII